MNIVDESIAIVVDTIRRATFAGIQVVEQRCDTRLDPHEW